MNKKIVKFLKQNFFIQLKNFCVFSKYLKNIYLFVKFLNFFLFIFIYTKNNN